MLGLLPAYENDEEGINRFIKSKATSKTHAWFSCFPLY